LVAAVEQLRFVDVSGVSLIGFLVFRAVFSSHHTLTRPPETHAAETRVGEGGGKAECSPKVGGKWAMVFPIFRQSVELADWK
jgi:hypothetical protein